MLITLFVVPWGLFTRAQRDLLRTSHERAPAARGRAARARRAGARGRAAADRGRDARRARAPPVAALACTPARWSSGPDAPPEEIAEAAGVIRANAHEALQELREVIGVLRADGRRRRSRRSRRWTRSRR